MTDKFYLGQEWRTFRNGFLRQYPRCSVDGCPTRATHVDHIVSRRKGGMPFDPFNCQALCAVHHNQKTARLDQPGRKASSTPLRAAGCDAAGWPNDPRFNR
jgi:5-methylcytosine-specific restriction endonuclease McrA